MRTPFIGTATARSLLVAVATFAVLFSSACQDPNNVLRVDRFTVQFTRLSTTSDADPSGDDDDTGSSGDDDDTGSSGDDDDTGSSGDDDDSGASGDDDDSGNAARGGGDDDDSGSSSGDDDDSGSSSGDDDDSTSSGGGDEVTGRIETVPALPVTKTVTIENLGETAVALQVSLEDELPEAGAFTIDTQASPTTEGLPEPFNYEVAGHSELGLAIIFEGTRPGVNHARLRIRNDEVGYDVTVVLQGTVDCISLGWDADKDGQCVQVDEPDCDDADYDINTSATEVCEDGDQVDNNCDGDTWVIRDADGDGYCDLTDSDGTLLSCAGAEEDLSTLGCFGDGTALVEDCDDSNASVSPGETEVCEEGDQVDNNCDESDDEQVKTTYIKDNDGDNFGSYDSTTGDGLVEICGEAPSGYVMVQDDPNNPGSYIVDCDDTRTTIYPGASEICDGLDNDCDGCIGTTTCAGETGPAELADDLDADFDGRPLCAEDAGGNPLDCDDDNPYVYSGAPELCDGNDNDCDALTPEEEVDTDGDQYVECEIEPAVVNDTGPDGVPETSDDNYYSFLFNGVVLGGGDCEPLNAAINPEAAELIDGLENNCDSLIDPSESDDDGDCFCEADPSDSSQACYPNPACSSTLKGDCDDSVATVFDGAPELCDALDNNCDQVIPADEADDDGDGFVECTPAASSSSLSNGIVGYAGGSDCNDDPADPTAPDTYPDAPEISDSYYDTTGDYVTGSEGYRLVDNQCSGDVGFGSYCEVDIVDCLEPACMSCTGDEQDGDSDGLSEADGDCDDTNDLVRSGNPEICDGLDNDCDEQIPGPELDPDGDGYVACWPPPGAVTTFVGGGDCEPNNISISPGASEVADGVDTDCDEDTVAVEEADNDGDGFTVIELDCDDNNALVFPGAAEICDELDSDCDGSIGDGTNGTADESDTDGDGYTVCGDSDCLDSDVQLFSELIAAGLGSYPGTNAKAVATAIHPDADSSLCDGWVSDCTSTTGAQEYLPASGDEFDDDGDGFVECVDSGFAAWTDNVAQANFLLTGGNDCADTDSQTGGVGTATAFDDIFPDAPTLCDGWVNDCTGTGPDEWEPTSSASPDEVDQDGDRYIECSNYIPADASNGSFPLLGASDCLDVLLSSNAYSDDVNPGESSSDACDGYDTDCSQYVASSSSNTFDPEDSEELDQDLDTYIECASYVSASTAVNGNSVLLSGGDDCLDVSLSSNSWSDEVKPGANDVCDGWDTDCSSGLNFPPNNPGELDQDNDDYWECHEVTDTDWVAPPGLTGGKDCLDDTSNTWSDSVNPGAASELCDGYDTDCSQYVANSSNNVFTAEAANEIDDDTDFYFDCEDTSSTGYLAAGWQAVSPIISGADCNDGDATINPGENDTFANGNLVDNDCDDTIDEESLAAGDLVVTEISARTNAGSSKYIELFNTTVRPISLFNWTLRDNGSDNVVLSDSAVALTIQPGDFRLMCKNPSTLESVVSGDPCMNTTNWSTSFALDTSGDEIFLESSNSSNSTLVVDTLSWNSAVSALNESQGLDPTLIISSVNLDTDNDTPTNSNWCGGIGVWVAFEQGTPAALNTSCDPNKQDGDEDGWCENGQDVNGDLDCDGLDSANEVGEVTANCSNPPYCDCDDANSSLNPSEAEEACDGLDTDCDLVSPAATETDSDGDGYLPCVTYVNNGGGFTGARDCFDSSSDTYAVNVNPGVGSDACDGYDTDCSQYVANSGNNTSDPEDLNEVDNDLDGYIECSGFVGASTAENSNNVQLVDGDDCDDAVITVNIGVSEDTCDGVDTNCDSIALASTEVDNDNDGYLDCSGYTENGGGFSGGSDCLDISTSTNPYSDNVSPGIGTDICDGYDTDCSQYVANSSNNVFTAEAADEQDEDSDNYIECTAAAGTGYDDTDWVAPIAGLIAGADCFDTSSDTYSDNVNPGATEACDGYDTNCSTGNHLSNPSDENDDDGDRYMECNNFVGSTTAVNGSSQTFLGGLDCFDTGDSYSDDVNPGVGSDVCDGYDTDCSTGTTTPEDITELDDDNDQYVECPSFVTASTAQNGQSETLTDGDDCLDSSSDTYSDDVNPGATEACDGFDTDCSSGNSAPNDVLEVDDDGDQYVECGNFDTNSTAQNSESETLIDGGDCNDGHSLVTPVAVLAISPGSGTTATACLDADGDDYCLGGGKDQNSDGDCTDSDEDYDTIQADGGEPIWGDCDDATVATAGSEDVIDELDNDADGFVDEDCIDAGAIGIVEVFSDDAQTDPDSMDWFEVLNLSWHDVYIDCWEVSDGVAGDSFVVETGTCSAPVADTAGAFEVARQTHEVLAEDAANLTGFPDTPLFDWGATVTFAIDNFTATPDDTIQLAVDTTTVDTLNYTAAALFAFVPTATQSLEYSGTTPLAYSGTAFEVDTLNDLGTNWCIALSTTAWSGFAATPFAANTCN